MWSQYASSGLGIAITSSYRRICDALALSQDRFFVGLIRYLDWNTQAVDNTTMSPFSKRKSYEHEKELRIVHWDLESQSGLTSSFPNCPRT